MVKGDPFRRAYGTLTEDQKLAMDLMKARYEMVWILLNDLAEMFGNSRDLSIARHDLQNSCMWAGRAVTKAEWQE